MGKSLAILFDMQFYSNIALLAFQVNNQYFKVMNHATITYFGRKLYSGHFRRRLGTKNVLKIQDTASLQVVPSLLFAH
jgi:hypothetical protein